MSRFAYMVGALFDISELILDIIGLIFTSIAIGPIFNLLSVLLDITAMIIFGLWVALEGGDLKSVKSKKFQALAKKRNTLKWFSFGFEFLGMGLSSLYPGWIIFVHNTIKNQEQEDEK